MSEKEKETIEDCKELVQELKQHKDKDFIGRLYYKNKPVEDILSVLLNLIEKQQKELNNIKEIEQSHQEENGKLRVALEKEKEKNKELEEEIENWKFTTKYVEDNYIDKAKIRVKINKLNNSEFIEDVIAIPYLKELLEEK